VATKIEMTLPYDRETTNTIVFAVYPMTAQAVGQIYIRKDHLLAAGHKGPWPTEAKVTVEVA
jgi:hypothetical protein